MLQQPVDNIGKRHRRRRPGHAAGAGLLQPTTAAIATAYKKGAKGKARLVMAPQPHENKIKIKNRINKTKPTTKHSPPRTPPQRASKRASGGVAYRGKRRPVWAAATRQSGPPYDRPTISRPWQGGRGWQNKR